MTTKNLKRKSIQEKLEILLEIDEGNRPSDIAERHNLTSSAVTQIRKRKIAIIESATNYNWKNQKNKVKVKNSYLDEAVYIWFKQKRSLGESISGPLLCEKAKLLNAKLNGSLTFRASNGWLEKFKRRYGIRQISSQGEKMSCSSEAAKEFAKNLQIYIEEQGIPRENIYNADETELNWKSMPKRTNEECVSVVFCANASGTHRIPLLLVGNCRNFDNCTNSPVFYKDQPDAWIDRDIFIDWFKTNFIPSVLSFQQENNSICRKILLIIDNAPCHPTLEELNYTHPNFEVIFLPPNVTANIQPMNQGPIDKTKRIYKKNVMKRLLLQESEEFKEKFLQNFSLKDCFTFIAASWNQISENCLRKVWKYLLISDENTDDFCESDNEEDESLLVAFAAELLSSSSANVLSWLQTDDDGPGWKILSDDDIIASVVPHNHPECNNGEVNHLSIDSAEIFVNCYKCSRRNTAASENSRVRRVLRPRTEPRSYAESPDALINGSLSGKPRTNGTAESESSDSDEGEMPPLAPIKELTPQEIWQRERGLRRLREELRAEEMKLVLLKKLRQSQQLKENVAVVPPAIPQQALPPTGLPSGLSITPTTVKVPSTKQPQNAHSRHNNNQKPSGPGQVSSLHRGPPPARSSLHAPSLPSVSITSRNSSSSLSVPQPPQRNSLNRPVSSFSAVAKELSPAVTITPAPPQPQNKGSSGVDSKGLGSTPLSATDQERNRGDDNQTPAQRQAAAKLALRKQLEKTLLQIPPPKPPPPEMHFIPNPSNTEFIYLVGLEHVVDFLTKEPKTTVQITPHACQQCKADFTPVWKWEKQSKNRQSNATFPQPSSSNGKEVRVICEQCVTSNVKKALKAEHTNRLKTAFVKALQQEQEIEQRLAQNGVFQVSCNSPAPSPAAPEAVPKAATPTPAPTPRHAATPPAPPPAQPTPPPTRQSHSSAQDKFSQSAAAMQALHQQLLRGLSAGTPPHMLPFSPLFYPYQLAMAQASSKGATPNIADIQRAAELQRQYLLDMIPPQAGQARHNWKT